MDRRTLHTNDQDHNAPTRRQFVKAGAGFFAAATAHQALGQERGGGATTPAGASEALTNPVSKFPQPPFPKQELEWPGLGIHMQPRPDHGEQRYRGSARLQGRRALITGGDSGIGRAVAIAFLREGADVAINYLPAEQPDVDDLKQAVRDATGAGRKLVTIPGDIRDQGFCEQLVTQAVEQLGGLDILVNNAARQQWRQRIEDLSPEDWDATFKTNIYAVYWITRAAMPHLKPGSSIINTASIVAFDPPPILLDYATTKGALVTFTQALAKQLGERGIRVNAVAPGPIWTPLQPSGGQPTEQLPQFGANTPLRRPGQPVELASTYVMLASAEASYSSGEIVGVTGGRPLP